MTVPDRDQDMREHEQWQDLIDATAPERIGEAAMQRVIAVRARRRWWRRFGAPAGLAAGVLAVAGAAAATGVLSFGGLAGTASHDDASTRDLRALIGELERRGGGGQSPRSGVVRLDGLAVEVALDDRRLCFSAAGDKVSGKQHYDRPDPAPIGELPRSEDVPRVADPRQRVQVACVDVSRLDGDLPVISGSDSHGSWIVALAPDQIASVDATAGGQTVELKRSQNLAVGRSSSPFTRVRWRTVDAKSRTSSIGSK
jgi:hypothetical protein